MNAFDPSLLLFVPGDRPDRFAKALESGASGAILDLEDAVSPDRKAVAREAVRAFLEGAADRSRVAVRMNPPAGDEGRTDLAMLAAAPAPAALLVPKVDDAATLARITAGLGGVPLIALIETARGLTHCEAIAATDGVLALAFGPYDLAAELGGESTRDVLLPHRARMMVAARAGGVWALDGPSREYGNPAIPAADADHARRLGFDGKLLIHPAQIAPVRAAFTPSSEELAYARRIVAAAERGSPAVLDGTMIDTPIVTAALRIVARAGVPRLR
jgi:citrate lyase subunit beta/citryl-CoA lyase